MDRTWRGRLTGFRVTGTLFAVALRELAGAAVLGSVLAASSGHAAQVTPSSSAGGQPLRVVPSFYLPVELGDGGIWGSSAPVTYAASLRLHPTVGIGSGRALRLGATGAIAYFSPEIEFLGGARVSYRVMHPVDLLGSGLFVHLAGEALWGSRNRRLVGGAVILDADRFAQLTVRAGRELHNHATFFEISAGTDIALWATPPAARPPTISPQRFPKLTGFYRILAVRMSTEASWLLDSGADTARTRARAVLPDATGTPDVQSLLALLRSRGLEKLARNVEAALQGAESEARHEGLPVPDFQNVDTQRQLVNALVHGWRVAMGESPGG